jgi:cobaltochelatase CobT
MSNAVINSASAVARAMSKKGIKVSVQGSKAYTDGKRIVIPDLGPKLGKEMQVVLTGYLDHEIGHCNLTDFTYVGFQRELPLFGLLEDIREENLLGIEYPGAKKNLTALNNHIIKGHPQSPLYTEGYRLVAGQKIVAESQLDKLTHLYGDDIIDRLKAMETTRDACLLAKALKKELEEKKEEAEEQELEQELKEASEGEPEKDDSGDDAPAEDTEDTAGDTEDTAGDTEDTEDTEDTPGGTDDTPGDEPEENSDGMGYNDAKGEEADESDEGQEAEEGAAGGSDEDTASPAPTADELEQELKSLDEIKDKGEELESELNSAVNDMKYSDAYRVFSTEGDFVKTAPEGYIGTFAGLKNSLGNLNTVRAKFTQLFKTQTAARWTGDRDRGRINNKALARVATGNRRVFKEKYTSKDLDTAVTFLVDFSGSMEKDKYSDRIGDAMKAVVLFLETLNSIGIKSEVLGYSTRGPCPGYSAYSPGYGRIEKLATYVFKSFDEPYNKKVQKRIAGYNSIIKSQNCDPCSVRVAHDRIAARKESRKVLFVLTDGIVQNLGDNRKGRKELKRYVKDIMDARRVEIVGVGMDAPEVSKYYPRSISVSSENLATELLNGIKAVFSR